MIETIAKILALILIAAWCISTCWLNWLKGKWLQDREFEAKYIRARGLLNLSDKPYRVPKQEERTEIEVIQGKREPLVRSGWEY